MQSFARKLPRLNSQSSFYGRLVAILLFASRKGRPAYHGTGKGKQQPVSRTIIFVITRSSHSSDAAQTYFTSTCTGFLQIIINHYPSIEGPDNAYVWTCNPSYCARSSGNTTQIPCNPLQHLFLRWMKKHVFVLRYPLCTYVLFHWFLIRLLTQSSIGRFQVRLILALDLVFFNWFNTFVRSI